MILGVLVTPFFYFVYRLSVFVSVFSLIPEKHQKKMLDSFRKLSARVYLHFFYEFQKRGFWVKAKNKAILTTVAIALVVSTAVVWASNNVDAIEDKIGD